MTEYVNWPRVGPYWVPASFVDPQGITHYGLPRYFPPAKILVDATFLLIALAFVFRRTPQQRADRARQIVIPLIAGFLPLVPFLLLAALKLAESPWRKGLEELLGSGSMSLTRFSIGVCLLTVGNALDVWGYGVLLRSLSIVAEARVLKIKGPYRFVRHPIYLGQFIAQAGYWLFLTRLQAIWVVFYLVFVGMQLYRSHVEEEVLERAFGEPYRQYKRQTFWFIPAWIDRRDASLRL